MRESNMATVAAPLEFVETLADLRFPKKSDALMQQLMDQNSEGKLTPAERDELEALVDLSEHLALLRAQALRLLERKPA